MKVAVCLGLLFAGRIGAAQPRAAVNLVTHNRIEIARPAAVIWPYILEPNLWKMGAKLVHRSGPAGQVGEVFGATEPNVTFLVENVELISNRRRTIKLYQPDGTLLGYATWTLEESGGRSTVGYDVYSESLFPPGQAATAEALAKAELLGNDANVKRFKAEFGALKRLVER